MPSAPACSTSEKISDAPRMTRPVLTKNSVCTAGLSHSGVPTVLEMSRPSPSAKMTYSMPQSTKSPLPARKRAPNASAKMTGSPSRNGATREPTNAMPSAPTIRKPMPTVPTFSRLACVNTLSVEAAAWPRTSVPSAPGSVREPSAASLPAAVSICLRSCVASADFRSRESVTTFVLRLRGRVADDRVECPVPVRREQLDLLVGRPAEGRHHIAQVGDLPLESQQHGRDHQEAENDRDPVLGAPGARRRGRCGSCGCGVGEGLFRHGTSPGDVREDARDHEKDEDDGGGHSPECPARSGAGERRSWCLLVRAWSVLRLNGSGLDEIIFFSRAIDGGK